AAEKEFVSAVDSFWRWGGGGGAPLTLPSPLQGERSGGAYVRIIRNVSAFSEALSTFHHEGIVQDVKFLDRRGGDGATFGVNVGIRIVELHQCVIELEAADASVDGAAMIA